MGKEANCHCQWADASGECKALLETHELVVRGAGKLGRRRAAVASLTDVRIDGDLLRFRAQADDVSLKLGAAEAKSWAKKLTTPPPTLAAKLGITSATRLALIGEFETEELNGAVAQAASRDGDNADLILAVVATEAELDHALEGHATHAGNPAIWIIYPKGANRPLREAQVLSAMRGAGFVDTKVAGVSEQLTGLRFVRRG